MYWVQRAISATHTVETVIEIINAKGETRTTTETNTDIDTAANTAPSLTDAEGKQIYVVTQTAGGKEILTSVYVDLHIDKALY